MSNRDDQTLLQLAGALRELLLGRINKSIFTLPETDLSSAAAEIFEAVKEVLQKHQEAYAFLSALANGNLEENPPPNNHLISPFKALQSNLRHLTWQTQEIAAGDYSQHVAYMGEFSVAFNKMINSLKEQEKLKKQVAESEKLYRLLAENASDVIWKLDPSTARFSYISPSIEKLRGLTVEEALHETLPEAIAPESLDMVQQGIEKIIQKYSNIQDKSSLFVTKVIRQPHKDGRILDIEVSISVIPDDNGNLREILGVSRNVSARVEAERKLREDERMLRELNATKDKFFSIISHDLRNPFHIILSYLELIKSELETSSPSEINEMINRLLETTSSSYKLLENLLQWSKTQRGLMVPAPVLFPAQQIIDEAVKENQPGAEKKNVRLIGFAEKDSFIFADIPMLQTVIRNLMSNAIKFSYPGGVIRLKAKNAGEKVALSITDSGTGIDLKDIEKLFRIDATFSTKGTASEKGSGLGLILCKELIEKNNGTITVQSEIGKGSTFLLELPIHSSVSN